MSAITFGLALLFVCSPLAARQTQQPTAQPPAGTPPSGPAAARTGGQAATGTAQASTFTPEQLEQIVAPVALYPDSLLSQILMGSTYPLEIVEAARWLAKNGGLKGDKLDTALQSQTWDPSIKALCAVPDVVKRMNDNLDWTQDLGDAFLGQREAVMKTVQAMRQKALEAGTLKSGKEMTVTEQADKIIVIESSDPEVVYVPTYYPSAVYGSWSYPYYYYPPMYPPPPAGGLWFGFTVGVIWGGAWGDCNWGGDDIDIDIDNQNNFIDRTENSGRRDQVKNKAKEGGGNFKHNPEHRKGVSYKDNKVAQNFGASAGNNRVTRDQARGYGDRSAKPSAGTRPPTGAGSGAGAGTRPSTGAGTRPSTQPSTRPSTGSGARPSTGTRPSTGSLSGSRSPSMDRSASSRGGSSRGSGGARASRGGGGGGRRR